MTSRLRIVFEQQCPDQPAARTRVGGEPVAVIQQFCERLRGLNTLHVSPLHLYTAFRPDGLHKDPFDRLLIAQALVERLTLATQDHTIRDYNVETVW
jgi:PIN domain nuclease of toxin-antitoxin system